MTKKKQKQTETEENWNSGTKIRIDNEPKDEDPNFVGARKPQAEELWNRTNQVVSIFNKGLDLVESGFSLGVKVLNRLGEQITIKTPGAERPPEEGYYYPPPEETGHFYQQEPKVSEETSGYPKNLHVVNRLPLFPGSPVQVSFSINNDSSSSAKKLQLKIEGFLGEAHQFQIDARTFSIQPAERVIAPMDFEKFVLTGNIPPESPVDTYNGWIVISGEENFNILVSLVVTMPLQTR